MRYAKAILAVVATAEWINVAIAGVGAVQVLVAVNVPGAEYTKVILPAVTAVLTFLVSAVAGGVTQTERQQIIVVALGAVGVWGCRTDHQPPPPLG